MLYIVMHPESA
ncbi:hypothetical protein MTR67_007380 [Solanum verrucosum]|uniref:Uncharacterized protein n=1 Tax=Solanum verrucosum TaxID=315347 RepID=A0AAF0Q388_SOLVR|nr:hypothetical protein MTR67_007380 [Solanum verrucosum]